MKPTNPIETMCVYASNSSYKDGPSVAQQAAGTVPLDTLPADWWNWLWSEITQRINQASAGMQSVYSEILSVLSAAQVTPSETSTDQLLTSIRAIARTIGTSGVAGAVKSSSDSGKVAIDVDGFMSPNGMGVPTSLNTTSKVIVNAINEVLSALSTYESTNDAAVAGKAPTNHASSTQTYGVGNAENYGHLKLTDAVSDTGVSGGLAATPKAVKNVQDNLDAYETANDAAVASKLGKTECAADSNKIGGTTKGGLFTALSVNDQTISATVGGTTLEATMTVPGSCFGTTTPYIKYNANPSGTASAAECRVNIGYGRAYDYSESPQATNSYDRRTYSYIGTYQDAGACSGMTYLDTCVWQCCYSGTEGVTTCTNRRWCFCGNGNLYTPGAVIAQSANFGCMLVANRVGSDQFAAVTFCNCNGLLGHIGMNTVNGDLVKWNPDGSASCKILTSNDSVSYASNAGYATNAGTAASTDYASSAHYLRTFDVNGNSHGTNWMMYWQWDGSFFTPRFNSGSNNVWVNRAGTAGSADSATTAGCVRAITLACQASEPSGDKIWVTCAAISTSYGCTSYLVMICNKTATPYMVYNSALNQVANGSGCYNPLYITYNMRYGTCCYRLQGTGGYGISIPIIIPANSGAHLGASTTCGAPICCCCTCWKAQKLMV